MDTKRLIKHFLILLIFFIASLLIRYFLLDGVDTTKLQSGPALAAAIAPSIISPGANNLPEVNSNYKVLNSHYFDNGQWAIVSIASLPSMNTSVLVLEKIGGVFTVVLGPGTYFSISVTRTMPADVSAYLISRDLVH